MAVIRQGPTGKLDIELSGDTSQYIFGWVSEWTGEAGDADFRDTLRRLKAQIAPGNREWWDDTKQWVVERGYEAVLAALFSNWGEAVKQLCPQKEQCDE